ncbi:MAG TPA: lipocalin family protein [Phenylobacterium sp.]|jgi:apolipoprotein D and lipocalin family protein
MLKRLIQSLAAAGAIAAAAGTAAAEEQKPAAPVRPIAHMEIGSMMGRWYEVARFPNSIQRGCQAGASDWIRTADGFAVTQSCHKGAPDGPISEWKAKARVADPVSNAKFKMSFFGGLVSQEYWVLDQRPDEGWLILATHDGHYLWLMSTKPTLPQAVRSEAVARIRQLGFDATRLEFPLPGRG